MSDPTVCLYHKNCVDGFGAALAVWTRYGNAIRYLPMNYDSPFEPHDYVRDHVLIVDFSFKRQVMENLAHWASSVTILDHHKSAEADLTSLLQDGVIDGQFNMTQSGAVLAWQLMYPGGNIPDLLLSIQDYDLWAFKRSDTRAINAWLNSYPFDFKLWNRFLATFPTRRHQFITEGCALLRQKERDIDQWLPQMTHVMSIGGHLVPAANLPKMFASEAAGRLAEREDAAFGVCYFDKIHNTEFSLRSRGPDAVDVSKIAEQYGGGGHAGAAGFHMPHGWRGDPWPAETPE